jgi:DUF1680 family protein
VTDVVIDPGQAPALDGDEVVVRAGRRAQQDRAWPYAGPAQARTEQTAPVALVPYHAWAERGPSTMRVWLPVE